jgi:hypothetical protein
VRPSTSEQKPNRGIAIAAVLTIAVAATVFVSRSNDAEAPVSPAPVPETKPLVTGTPAASASVPTPPDPAPTSPASEPRPANGAPHGKVTFPDGSVVEAINDVAENIPMQWDDRPYSPIADKVFHNGWWWWKHQDGTYSTVKMVTMNGVPQAISMSVQVNEQSALPTLEQAEIARMVGAPPPQPQRPNAPK